MNHSRQENVKRNRKCPRTEGLAAFCLRKLHCDFMSLNCARLLSPAKNSLAKSHPCASDTRTGGMTTAYARYPPQNTDATPPTVIWEQLRPRVYHQTQGLHPVVQDQQLPFEVLLEGRIVRLLKLMQGFSHFVQSVLHLRGEDLDLVCRRAQRGGMAGFFWAAPIRRYADIGGGEDIGAAPIRRYPGPGDIGAAPIRRYPGLGGYRRGADTPISGTRGISVRRRYADIRGWGDIDAAPIRRYPGLGGYRCIGVSVRRRGWGISVYRCIGAAQGLARYLCVSMSARRRGWRDIGSSVRWGGGGCRCIGVSVRRRGLVIYGSIGVSVRRRTWRDSVVSGVSARRRSCWDIGGISMFGCGAGAGGYRCIGAGRDPHGT